MQISELPIYYFHIIAFIAGFILDAILGDPYRLPHPVKFMGALIARLEKHYLGEKAPAVEAKSENAKANKSNEENDKADKDGTDHNEADKGDEENAQINESRVEDDRPNGGGKVDGRITEYAVDNGQEKECDIQDAQESAINEKKRVQGRETVLIVLAVTLLVTDVFLIGGYIIHPILGCVIETIMTYQALAAKCLVVESMKVYKALTTGTIEEARKAVSMIVGRDTQDLDEAGVTRAAVETVAENASDGVIAPMLYLAIGGPVLGFAYKAINTMDSMIGYKNERYLDFGRAAAKLDDIANFLPSRISAWLMILVCPFIGNDYIASEAKRIYLRDRFKHSSPNSAQTESACAGALGIKLGGDASYFGKLVHKPELGDGRRRIDPLDIGRTNHLMYAAAILCELLCIGLMVLGVYLFYIITVKI